MKNKKTCFHRVQHLSNQFAMVLLLAFFGLLIAFGWTHAYADIQLPDSIKVIEDEAFLNVPGFSGVVTIPQTVVRVGENTFSGTNPYAIVVPSSVEYFGKQNISSLSYIHFQGNTKVTAASVASAAYVIGPAGSSAEAAAQAASVPFVEIGDLYTIDNINYQKIDEGFCLLSPIDNTTISTFLEIPGIIGATPVIDCLPTAFQNCNRLQSVELPDSLQNIVIESSFPEGIVISYKVVDVPKYDFNIIVPEQIAVGQKFSVKFYVDNSNYNLGWADINVVSFDGTVVSSQSINVESHSVGGICSVDYSASRFLPGYYYIQIQYDEKTACKPFQIIETERPKPPLVSTDKTEYMIGENIVFSVFAEEATELSYNIWIGDSSSQYNTHGLVSLVDNTYVITKKIDNEYVSANFTVCKDDIWSETTYVTVNVVQYETEKEKLDSPIIEITSTNLAGQDLYICWDKVENAESYFIDFIDSSARTIYSIKNELITYHDSYCSTIIPGYYISQGKYTILLSASATDYITSVADKTITITGVRPQAPEALSLNPDNHVAKSHMAYFVVNTADAEKMIVRYYQQTKDALKYSNILLIQGISTQYSKTLGYNVGEEHGFSFSIYKDGVWSDWSDFIIVTVVDQILLEMPTLNVPDQVSAGSNVLVKVDFVEHATNYELVLYRDNQYIYGNSYSGAPDVTWQAYMLEPGIYTVKATVSDNTGEYATNSNSATFTVTGNKSDPPMVTSNIQEVMVQENYSFTIDTTGADRMAVNYGTALGNYNSQEVWDTETVWRTYSYSAGTYSYRFALRKNGIWTAWSDPVSVTVREGEKLPAPSLTVAESFVAGQNIELSFTAVANATNYRVRVYDSEGNSILDNSVAITNGEGQWTIPGYRLANGEYTVTVTVSASGYSSSSASSSFIVTGSRPLAATFTLYDTEVDTLSADYWTLIFKSDYLSNVESVVSRSWVQGDTNLYYTTYDVSENNTCQTQRWIYSGNTYCYAFSVLRNGVWSDWSQVIRITP